MKINPILLTDGYKTGHHHQYPDGTTSVYSNWTARSNKYAPTGANKVLSIGQQLVIRWLVETFNEDFFGKPKEDVCSEIKRELSLYLNCDYDVSHFEKLHDLGYLPIHVKSIKEGTEVPIRIPMLTIKSTHNFGWVTNFLETILSNMLWQPMTSGSIALLYRRIMTKWANKTDIENIGFIDWQCHDFSMRGMGGLMSAILSGIGHASVFSGSDTLPVISAMRHYYDAKGFVIGSVNATEHSVMCAGSKDGELETFRRLMDIYPTGILSIVSDTWNLWDVITKILPILKEEILARDGKLVIRPDSGDPVDIICGTIKFDDIEDYKNYLSTSKHSANTKEIGVIELLWDLFGGTVNDQGFKVLDSHIGAIYGDSITPARAEEICSRLVDKGFASTNIVLGIGSYTYQYNTRDTFGFAMKATYIEINGEGKEIFKDPITDNGVKKSAKGLLCVTDINGELVLTDEVNKDTEDRGELITIFKDGTFYNQETLEIIRERIKQLK